MVLPALGFINLLVSNPLKSRDFYQEILGCTPVQNSPTFVLFALDGGVMLGLWSKYTVEPRIDFHGSSAEICFAVQDVEAIYHAWSTKQVTIAQKPSEMEFGHTFVALDPDGHRVRVYRLKEDRP